jgi:hypothetical protein
VNGTGSVMNKEANSLVKRTSHKSFGSFCVMKCFARGLLAKSKARILCSASL